MASMVEEWAGRTGHEILAKKGHRSPTVTAVRSDRVPPADVIKGVSERCGAKLGSGYGDTKPTHYRIGHMGEHTPDEVAVVLGTIDATLAASGK
jgi:aspartate aminotransferase-like enzyme